MSRLAGSRENEETVEDSCVYHGPTGCVMDRTWRADLCNSFQCNGKRRTIDRMREVGTTTVLWIADERGSDVSAVVAYDDARGFRTVTPDRQRRTGVRELVKQAEEAQFVDLIACERDCRNCSYAAALDCDGNCGVCPHNSYCPCVNPVVARSKTALRLIELRPILLQDLQVRG